jgi:hypothetical protein
MIDMIHYFLALNDVHTNAIVIYDGSLCFTMCNKDYSLSLSSILPLGTECA